MHIIVEGDSEWKTNASWHTVAPNVNKTGSFCPSSKTARCGLTRRQLSYDCTFSLWIGATRIWPSDGLFHFCIFNIRRMYKMSQLHKDECVLAKKPVNSITLQAISGSSHTLLSTVVLPVWPFFFKALSVTWSKAAENFFFFFCASFTYGYLTVTEHTAAAWQTSYFCKKKNTKYFILLLSF